MVKAKAAERVTVAQLAKLFPADCFALRILRASGKCFRSNDSMVPVDNKMIFSLFFCLTNICLVLEAGLAAAPSIWSTLELMFQWHKLGKADHWRLLYSEKLRSGGSVQCLLLTFALTKKHCCIRIAQESIIMLLWCAGCCFTGFLSLFSPWLEGEWGLFSL